MKKSISLLLLIFFFSSYSLAAPDLGTYDDVEAAAVPTDDGYRIEAKIPWSIFGVNPDVGKDYGFAFSISDNDKSGENVQQSMVSNAPNRHLTDPTTWGELTLEGHQ